MPRGPARPGHVRARARGGDPRWRSGKVLRVSAGAFALVALGACSLIVNHASSQCGTDADCAKFVGTSCVQGGCVDDTVVPEAGLLDISVEAPANQPCTSTQDCLADNGGSNWVCLTPEQTCAQLTSADCPFVGGDYTGDDALILGAILPLYGAHATTGTMLRNAIELGLNDFLGGLPSMVDGGLPRHVAVVFCDESGDPTRAAAHLQSLKIPAIIGAGESATTLAIVNTVTQAGQFLITPRATVDLGAYQAKDIVWRTCPTDAIEGAALTALTAQVASDVETQNSLSSVAVAIVHASDTESTQLDALVSSTLTINGALATAPANTSEFLDVSYGDPDTDPNPDAEYAQAITQLTTATTRPDVVVITGSTQAVHGVLGGLEDEWPSGRRPVYVLSSGLQTVELLQLVAADPSLAARIVGTAPGEDDTTYTNLASFLALYGETFADGGAPVTFGVAQAYDAFYTLVYAGAVARNRDLDGKDVSVALTTLLGPSDAGAPTSVSVGPNGVAGALAAIAAGKKVSLQGASAPLAFDVTTGNLVTDVQVWCIDASSSAGYVASGESYSASTGKLQGTLSNGCTD